MQITNGTVAFSRVVKVEDYGVNKKADVSLTFSLDEGDDAQAALDHVGRLVMARVGAMLDGKAPAPLNQSLTAPNTAEPEKPVQRKLRQSPAKIAAAVEKASNPNASEQVDIEDVIPAADAAAVDDFDLPVEPVKEITDVDLKDAAGRKNAQLKDPVKIRALIASFGEPGKPFQMCEIPQPKRQEFLDKLKALV